MDYESKFWNGKTAECVSAGTISPKTNVFVSNTKPYLKQIMLKKNFYPEIPPKIEEMSQKVG